MPSEQIDMRLEKNSYTSATQRPGWASQEAYESMVGQAHLVRSSEKRETPPTIDFGLADPIYPSESTPDRKATFLEKGERPELVDLTEAEKQEIKRLSSLNDRLNSMENYQHTTLSFNEAVAFQREMHRTILLSASGGDSVRPHVDNHLQALSVAHRQKTIDGSAGSINVTQNDGSNWFHHWGPRAGDRYDELKFANGDFRREYPDGSGFARNTKSGGNSEEVHWGPRPEDNYVLNQFKNGDLQIRYADGRGSSVNFDEHGNAMIRGWGLTDRQNFDAIIYKNGDRRFQYGDMSGYSLNQDGNGSYTVKHWSPEAVSNYQAERKFKSETASREFVKEIGKAYLDLPEFERSMLDPVTGKPRLGAVATPFEIRKHWFGVDILLPEKTSDIREWNKEKTPSASDKRTHFSQVPGLYHDHEGYLLVSEKGHAPKDTLRHEAGHALDYQLAISESPEFKAAWAADLSELSATAKDGRFRYYAYGRRTETFAEIYAGLNGERGQEVVAAFPRTAQLIKEGLSLYKQNFPAESLILAAIRDKNSKKERN